LDWTYVARRVIARTILVLFVANMPLLRGFEPFGGVAIAAVMAPLLNYNTRSSFAEK